MNYRNYNTYNRYSNYPSTSYSQYKVNSNDERVAGGFLGPFVLGGITGGLVAPFFYGGYNNRPYYYYPVPGPYYPYRPY